MPPRRGPARVVQVTARWGDTTLRAWRVESSHGFRAGSDATCDFAVVAETQTIVEPNHAAARTETVQVGDVTFEVQPLDGELSWEASPRRIRALSMAGATLASLALHVGMASACRGARSPVDPVDPKTRLRASQLALIEGYLARADEREAAEMNDSRDVDLRTAAFLLLARRGGRAPRLARRTRTAS